jgi:hypothetical protein
MNIGSFVRCTYDRMLDWRGVVVGHEPCHDPTCHLPDCCAIVEWTTPDGEKVKISHILTGMLIEIPALRVLAEQA